MNQRFPLLSVFSTILKIAGWLIIVAGVWSSLQQASAYTDCLPNCRLNIGWVLQNGAILITGVMTVAFGEMIGVFFSIEDNTHNLVELTRQTFNAPPTSQPVSQTNTPGTRLKELKELLKGNLITEDEYKLKRDEILHGV